MDFLIRIKKQWFLLIVLFLAIIIQAVSNLQLPNLMANIVNNGILKQDNSVITKTGLEMIAISLVAGIVTILISWIAAKISAVFSRDLRHDLSSKIEGFSLNEFNKFSSASLITRTTNDIQQIQNVFVMILRIALFSPVMGIGAVYYSYISAKSLSLIIILPLIFITTIIIILLIIEIPKFNVVQTVTDKLNLLAKETITGIRVIKAFNNEESDKEKFEEQNKYITKLNIYVNRLSGLIQPSVFFSINVTIILIIWIGAYAINNNTLQIGDEMAFMQYALLAISSFLMITMVFVISPRAIVSWRRINEVLKTPVTLNETGLDKSIDKSNNKAIVFDSVSYMYPSGKENTVNNISFSLNKGETLAIIGSTGSGKTTILKLIEKIIFPTSGHIYFYGKDIMQLDSNSIRNEIGYMTQTPIIFSGTIRDNLNFPYDNFTDEQIHKALDIAQASEFVYSLKNGIDTFLARGGTDLSGGQKQRISIARGVIKNRGILIFDDTFSALDFKTDLNLRKAIHSEFPNTTKIIVSQRVATITGAEHIIVLNQGSIDGIGTHDYLLENCETYKEIVESQLTLDEVNNNIS